MSSVVYEKIFEELRLSRFGGSRSLSTIVKGGVSEILSIQLRLKGT